MSDCWALSASYSAINVNTLWCSSLVLIRIRSSFHALFGGFPSGARCPVAETKDANDTNETDETSETNEIYETNDTDATTETDETIVLGMTRL